jgi:hypothetical protein
VNLRRTSARVLLSLLLLLAQQMGISHGMAHWSGTLAKTPHLQAPSTPSRLSASLALDQTCDQCLAFAQIAAAVGSPAHAMFAERSLALAIAPPTTPTHYFKTVCAFQPRAPPAIA